TTPFLRVGLHSALGRLGFGWYPPHPLEEDTVRPFCGDARCWLKVPPGSTGAVTVDLHVPPDAVRGGSATVRANNVEATEKLSGTMWQTLRVEGVRADEKGLVEVRLQAPPFRPHEVFTNWDFRELGGAVRNVFFVADDEPESRSYEGVSVIITTYKRWSILEMTLDALRAQDWSNLQVVVMDDGSGDETWENLQAYRDEHREHFRLKIATQENQGQGMARNNSLSMANEDLVLFLGDDIIPEPDMIRAHVERHNAIGEYSAVVGFTDWYRKEINVTPFMEMVNVDGHQFGYSFMKDGADQPFTCFYTSNISIDRKILGEKPFDPTFNSYGWEDVELGYRLSLRGVRIIYEKAACAGHHHMTTVKSFYRRQLQVGRTHHDLLAIHPELLRNPYMPPERPRKWYRFTGPFVGFMVGAADALDRRNIPVPKKVLHHLMMIGFFRGRASF
ncbi:MAG: glycosyltransferase family 2 protein, partial [Thermoanaerobaculales bacterium]|nr:glycosyltransferase family 2 protein [Thermoanaerobaculales bacterium]